MCIVQGRGSESQKRTSATYNLLALLNTGLDGLVELSVESALRGERDLVVRGNILLDSLAAEKKKVR